MSSSNYTQNRTTSGPFSASTSTSTPTSASTSTLTESKVTVTSYTIPGTKSSTSGTIKPKVVQVKKVHSSVKIDSNGKRTVGSNSILPKPEIEYKFKIFTGDKNLLTPSEEITEELLVGGHWLALINTLNGETNLESKFTSNVDISRTKITIKRWTNGKIGSTVELLVRLYDCEDDDGDFTVHLDTRISSGFTFEKLDKLQGRLRLWAMDCGYRAFSSSERALPIPLEQPPIHPDINPNVITSITSTGQPASLTYDRMNPKTWVPPLPVPLTKAAKKAKEAAARKAAGKEAAAGGSSTPTGTSSKKASTASKKSTASVTGSAAGGGGGGGDVDWDGEDGKSVKGSAKKGKGKAKSKPRAKAGDGEDEEFRESRKGGRVRKSVVIPDALGSDYDTLDEDDYSDAPPPKKSRASISSASSSKPVASNSKVTSKSPTQKYEDGSVSTKSEDEEKVDLSASINGSNKREADDDEPLDGTDRKRKR